MFTNKITLSAGKQVSGKKSKSPFIEAGLKENNVAYTANGARALKTSLNDFLDQFNSTTSYLRERSFKEVSDDMQLIYSQDKKLAMQLIMYFRTVTRKVKTFDGKVTELVQNGQGLKNEAIMRMLWVAMNDRKTFNNNLELFVSVGSFKDIFKMLRMDLQYHGFENRKLDWKFIADFVSMSLVNDEVSDLLKKYLPNIYSLKAQVNQDKIANTIIAKYLCSVIFDSSNKTRRNTYELYRKLKSSGTAHDWQQHISKRAFKDINFNTIGGRAVGNITSEKFLTKHGILDKFDKWIDSQEVIKFTGYPYELLVGSERKREIEKRRLSKQFEQLVTMGRDNLSKDDNGFIGVVDSSGSMNASAGKGGATAFTVAISLAIYLSELNKSTTFSNAYIDFNDKSNLRLFKGNNAVDKYINDCYLNHRGTSTNIMSVARILVDIKNKGVSEKDFPSGIVCFSDGEFNDNETSYYSSTDNKTIMKSFRDYLAKHFSKEFAKNFKIVLWDIRTNYGGEKPIHFYKDDKNSYLLSGLDGSVLKFILGTETQVGEHKDPKTPLELMENILSQEIFQKVIV